MHSEDTARVKINLDEYDWRFRLEKDMEELPQVQTVPVVSDCWEHVRLPHCWNKTDGADGDNDYVRGKGWYVTEVDFTEEVYADKKLYLEIGAACKIAEVYINGRYAGKHEGGYSRFRFPVTDKVCKDGKTQLAICVDNRINDLMPLSGDFTVFGGIYRDVNIIAVEEVHFDLSDCGSEGVLIYQTGIGNVNQATTAAEIFKEGGKIAVDAGVCLENEEKAFLQTVVYDMEGSQVAEHTVEITGGKETGKIKDQLIVKTPHLWDGVENPYLYTVKVFLKDQKHHIKDAVCKKTGFRFYYADEDDGFFLNGRAYPLRGVCKHQDRFGRGYAVSKADQEEDMAMIHEIGANAVRFAHYQHDEYVYELADRYGICAWAEIPLVNGMTDTEHFRESTKYNLEELIKQNISHPSIILWGIHNEQWPNNGGRINTLLRELYFLAHGLDANRLVTLATAQSQSTALSWQSDVSGWNKYFGLYEARDVRYFGTWLDQVRQYAKTHDVIAVTDESTGEVIKVPVHGKIGMSEYGVGCNVEYHEENPGYRIGTGFDAYQTEEFQAQWHEIYYQAIEERPWLWGTFVWNMFEFGSDSRSEAGRKGINNKGMVSYDRKIKKDVFYFYQANWSEKPTLHITGKRFQKRLPDVISVKVYANMDEIELFVNECSQGKLTKEEAHRTFVWKISLKPGENEVLAVGKKDGEQYHDSVTWSRVEGEEKSDLSNSRRESKTGEKSVVADIFSGTDKNSAENLQKKELWEIPISQSQQVKLLKEESSIGVQLTKEADTNDWYYLTGICMDWSGAEEKWHCRYELHGLNPVGIAGGYDAEGQAGSGMLHTEHWVSGKSAQIKDMRLRVSGNGPEKPEPSKAVRSVKVYGWRLSGEIVDESSASVEAVEACSVENFISLLKPKGNCTVWIADAEGAYKSNHEMVENLDKVIVTDIRGKNYAYTVKASRG